MITHVAIRFGGKTWSLPKPNRHHDVLRLIVLETGARGIDVPFDDEGFLDENGTYYRRSQALVHAFEHDQIKDPEGIRLGMLFSEDVW